MAVIKLQRQVVRSRGTFLLSILIIFILIHDFVPIVGYRTPAFFFAGIVALSFVMSIIVVGPRHFYGLLMKILPLFLLNILQLLHHIISGQGGVFIEFYGLVQYLIPPIFVFYVLEKRDVQIAQWMMTIIIVCCVITSITTYFGCLAFPSASRDLATTIRSEDSILYSTYMQLNIGGFGFIYKITLFIPIIIYLAKSRKLNMIIAIFVIVAFLFAIRQSEYATALLLSVIGLLSAFLSTNIERKKLFRYLALVVIVGAMLYAFVPPALKYYASNTESEIVASRLIELADVLSGENYTSSSYSDLDERQSAFEKSWDTFINSNTMGGWGSAKVGGHSYFLDTLGVYGLLGFILLIIMYTNLYNIYIKPCRDKPWYGLIILVLFLAVIQTAVNTDNSFSFISLIFPLIFLLENGQK